MIDIHNLIRKNIQVLKPYSSAREEYSGQEGIFLDANENAFGSTGNSDFNRYPDPLQKQLKNKIAKIKQVEPDKLFLGNGSDEAIDLLIRAFCEPRKERIMVMPPTYGMYEVCADINDVGVLKVSLNPSFEIDLQKVFTKITPDVKLIFISSPNNPTGNCFNAEAIVHILQRFCGLLIIDEAYIDLSPDKSRLPWISQYENLVILQTLSKAWGLANIRLGMAFASPAIVNVLNKIKYPYNVNGISQKIALDALDNSDEKDQMVQDIIKHRKSLKRQLTYLPFVETVYPSEANFLLVKMKEAQKVYSYLLRHRIIVRDRSQVIHCQGCLRITVGTQEENRKLIETLKKYK